MTDRQTEIITNESILQAKSCENENSQDRKSVIDIIKGIAILAVIITHTSWTKEERLSYLFPFWIDQAVPVFMIMSGYVNSLSYCKKRLENLTEALNFRAIISKSLRFIIPFLIAYFIEVIVYTIFKTKSPLELFVTLIRGGFGPGSYYTPVMLQFIFIFPIIYFIIKKYDFQGLLLCGAANLFFEFIKKVYGMPTHEYRLLVLRYVLLIASGCYLAIGKKKVNAYIYTLSFLIGSTWLYLVKYCSYIPKIIDENWSTTSVLSSFYCIPLFCVFFNKMNNLNLNSKFLEILGRASFNIFLTQMVYFTFLNHKISELFSNSIVTTLANIIICITFGIIFYKIETPFTSSVVSKLCQPDVLDNISNRFTNITCKLCTESITIKDIKNDGGREYQ